MADNEMTMVEAVAMALAKRIGDDWERPTFFICDANDTEETCRQFYLIMASDAIEAMHVPTQAMIATGVSVDDEAVEPVSSIDGAGQRATTPAKQSLGLPDPVLAILLL